MSTDNVIRVRGARTNNLRGIDLEIPKKKLTVVTGVSGSGKSSLAFDTIAAESQRLLSATYPAFVQNLMPHLPRPDVDILEGLSASIVVDQAPLGANPRSTVGTATDAWSLLRQLYAGHGTPPVPGPHALSFNSPAGMCPACEGTGRAATLEVDTIIDRARSLNEGAITFPNFAVDSLFWKVYARSGAFNNDTPVSEYTPDELEHLLHGTGPKVDTGSYPMAYEGVLTKITRLYLAKDPSSLKPRIREALEEAATTGPCPECDGTRLNPAARACTIGNTPITTCHAMPATELAEWLTHLDAPAAAPLIAQLRSLLSNLDRVGLGYLTLDRPTSTLSGGEGQRIRTVLHLDSSLTDLTYVFDEPAAGLHAHDTTQVLALLHALRDKGNTVLVVEHHPDVIAAADHVIDLGPGAGVHGGTITFSGTPTELAHADTLTARALASGPALNTTPRTPTGTLTIQNATTHNLDHLTVEIPLGVLTCITGVAGAGKSSLLANLPPSEDLALIGQQPIPGSRRSTAATYTGAMDWFRTAFAKAASTPDHPVKPGLFSANSAGACPHCAGLGVTYLEAPNSAPVAVTCTTCDGNRYTPEVLTHTLDGLTIAQVLALPVAEAAHRYAGTPAATPLTALVNVGLGYLTLGQPLSTLSGGERQRLRLATRIQSPAAIYVLDEPTTGLHMDDVATLTTLLHQLVEDGATVIAADHHLHLIASADHVIDLGPEAGPLGGTLTYQGPSSALVDSETHTGRALAARLSTTAPYPTQPQETPHD
ncbi:excinuclease ABC subunit UvrA [Micrococcus sp. ACRRV]|uniref:excinuclease ABC subunit UvrA n=1 Tax=Micrococcus sp. ACRRV TaxID=2918203 RepID=UPI001EF1C455|nr:excinuclease ABC subunit UvrA [Micrococcus sp. ACRRV]MCG7421416.1 excinuclease ABC subunit UvrA [Micrococcus sp. ACRRV]